MEELKAKFMNAYAEVPDALRKEIIVVIEGKPYTWNTAYFEVKENTELAKKILNTLLLINII